MDDLYVNDGGIADALNVLTAQYTPSKFSAGNVHLFKNNVVVSKTTALGALTEATFPGYATVTIASLLFPAASVASNLATSLAAIAGAFVCTGGGASESEYGAYVTDSTNAILLACWNFGAGPFTMLNNGDTIDVTPTLSSQSLN